MARQIITLDQIKLDLENETRTAMGQPALESIQALHAENPENLHWEEASGIFKVQQAEIDTEEKKVKDVNSSMVIKLFVNKTSMEVRQFISKFTDEKTTKDLP